MGCTFKQRGGLTAVVLVGGLVSGEPANAAQFYALTSACGPLQAECSYGGTDLTAPGEAPATSAISKSYTFVPQPGDGGGWNLGVNSSVTFAAPDSWRAYAQAGGYINVQEPFAGNSIGAGASAVIRAEDRFTPQSTPSWNTTGFIRFSWEIEGSVSVSYSAPGTPEQASASVSLGFECSSFTVLGTANSPCSSPDFDPAPTGSYTLNGSRSFKSSQNFSEVIDFDVFVQADRPVTVSMGAGVSAGIGLIYGTPPGTLNGLAAGDFLHTGKLIAVKLFDSFGNEITDASLLSESGFDYLNVSAVPEPSTYALMLAGLGLVGFAARRRKRA